MYRLLWNLGIKRSYDRRFITKELALVRLYFREAISEDNSGQAFQVS